MKGLLAAVFMAVHLLLKALLADVDGSKPEGVDGKRVRA